MSVDHIVDFLQNEIAHLRAELDALVQRVAELESKLKENTERGSN